MVAGYRRISFEPGDLDALIAFCVASGSPFDAAVIRRLIVDLTSDPAGVFVVADDAGPVLVASLFDRGENGADAAMLEILGIGAAVSREAFAELVVTPAIAFGRAGVRRAVHLPLQHAGCARIEGAEGVLRAAGFAPTYDFFTMRRPATAPLPGAAEVLPPGWRWQALEGGLVDVAHAALTEIFRDSASFTLSPLPLFRRAVASGASTFRALVDGDEIAGLVQVAAHETLHELRTIGRRPAYRGRGLGARLVTEGLRLLGEHGARAVELTVEAPNERALALYRRFAFDVVDRTPVFAMTLR